MHSIDLAADVTSRALAERNIDTAQVEGIILPGQLGSDPEEITRIVAPYLSIPDIMTAADDAP